MRDLVILISLDDAAGRTLARRLRAEHVYCRILPAETSADEILRTDARGILIAGGTAGQASHLPQMMDYLQTGLPMLCLGDAALTLCETLGGTLAEETAQSNILQVQFDHQQPIFTDVEDSERYLPACRHFELPEEQGAICASTENGALGFRVAQRDVWGLAFQLERNDPGTSQLLLNFCRDVCGCTLWWNHDAFIELAREEILQAADGGEAICALSGGVDSGVCALLGHAALGRKLHCIFIDTGLLREGEADQVMDFYQSQAGLNVHRIDASAEFLQALQGVFVPAEKERIITGLLQDVLCRASAELPNIRLLIQGTNFTDLQQIHDTPVVPVDGLPVIQPVRELFKDEIKYIGEALGMSQTMLQRQPFPGSGLALRVLTDVTQQKLELLRRADMIFCKEIEAANLQKRLWQFFAAVAESPMHGGGFIVTLRAVQTVDGAAAMAARLPNDLLERVTMTILSECPEVQRVMFDLTPSKSYNPNDWR